VGTGTTHTITESSDYSGSGFIERFEQFARDNARSVPIVQRQRLQWCKGCVSQDCMFAHDVDGFQRLSRASLSTMYVLGCCPCRSVCSVDVRGGLLSVFPWSVCFLLLSFRHALSVLHPVSLCLAVGRVPVCLTPSVPCTSFPLSYSPPSPHPQSSPIVVSPYLLLSFVRSLTVCCALPFYASSMLSLSSCLVIAMAPRAQAVRQQPTVSVSSLGSGAVWCLCVSCW
jgi:hypothetical protein